MFILQPSFLCLKVLAFIQKSSLFMFNILIMQISQSFGALVAKEKVKTWLQFIGISVVKLEI